MNSNKTDFFWRFTAVAVCLLPLGVSVARAQHSTPVTQTAALNASAAEIPDAPQAQQPASSATSQTTGSTDYEGKQTKRILGIIPNFRSVSANTKLPPMSFKDKFIGASEDSFDYSSFIFAGGLAGVAMAENSTPQFRQGAAGYGRYYWHTFADQTDENYWVEGLLPVVLHQDSRYYTLGHGGFIKRGFYSFSRIAVTRTDAGNEVPNVSEILGAGTASSISAVDYPSVYRTWTKVGQRWLTNVIIDGFTFSVKEFWPDVNNAIFHQKD